MTPMDSLLQSLSRALTVSFLLAACGQASAAQVQVTVEGLRGDLLDAAKASLSLNQQSGRDLTPAQDDASLDTADLAQAAE